MSKKKVSPIAPAPKSAAILNKIILTGLFFLIVYLAFTFFLKERIPADSGKLFSLVPTEFSSIDFTNHVREGANRGLQFYDYFYNGSGVSIGDINNDGLPDVFFTGNDVPNQLYLNKGGFKFENISQSAGIQTEKWGTGSVMIDVNQDGWLDIYVCNSGPYLDENSTRNELYINNKDNTFTEQAARYGIADSGRSTQAAFFDMDRDGDLDLWVMNHGLRSRGSGSKEWFAKIEQLTPIDYKRECSTLYQNDGKGKFTDISKAAGIEKIGFGLGIAVRDFNEDGFLDVYIANDYFIPDFMFMNNRNSTFTNKSTVQLGHTPYYSMGCDAADFNNDGLPDLVVVDMTPEDHERNKVLMASMNVDGFNYLTKTKKFTPQYMMNGLFVNNGLGVMSDIGLYAGVSQTDWSWAPLLADFDNDGYKDLMITNGYRKDTKDNDWLANLNKLRASKGANYSPKDYFEHLKKAAINPVQNAIFKNKNGLGFESKIAEWGFQTPSFSNGAAYGDLDQDGDLDLIVNNFDQAAFVYKNNSNEKRKNHFIQFKLKDGINNNKVLHSKINIYYDGQMQSNDLAITRGYQSSVEDMVHFGIGEVEKIDRAVIFWNDGNQSVIQNPKIDQLHLVDKKSIAYRAIKKDKQHGFFTKASDEYIQPRFTHQENDFDDFQREILLPHRQSTLGPAIAVGDVNGDDLDDFFIGGAKDQSGVLYLQKGNGHFQKSSVPAFEKDFKYEDCGAKFIDIDGDNDLDLYIASGGGGEFLGNENLLQDRLYLNDAKGHFVLAKGKLPRINSSTKIIAEADVDQDGDLDIFVGGRTTPGQYPVAPESYLLINDQGIFTNQIEKLAEGLEHIGMVTGAEWSDTNKDGQLDLVIVGEWMPITVFTQEKQVFKNNTSALGIDKTNGWWSSLHKDDLDKDGDDDFIVGNIGLNNKFHPTEKKPLYIYANDFDDNGALDIVLSKIYKDRKVPVRGKECSSTQMPFIAEKFPTYNSFATASLEDIYEKEQLSQALKYEAYNFASIYLENNGNGTFKINFLPAEAQLAPINGVVVKDFDKDGKKDLIVAGNRKQTEVETPQYDAGKGLFLKGLGNGKFETKLQIAFSGLLLNNDVKDLALIHLGKDQRPAFLVANNNDQLELIFSNQ